MSEITAIIPTYNRAKLLSRAIESVLHQTVPPAQIIVVDDGSTDDTREVCRLYSDRIEYVRQKNSGASAARNLGIEKARHRWIAFLDSDDYWTNTHLERLTEAIQATGGEATVYFSDMEMPSAEGGGTLWQHIGFQPLSPIHLVHDATAWALMKRQPMMLQTAAIDKAALQRAGGLDVRFKLSHDSYVFCQLLVRRPACAVSGLGCVQTSDDTSLTRLSVEIPLNSAGKVRESCMMWSEMLQREGNFPPAFHRLVRYNAAGSSWQVGVDSIRSGSYLKGLALLWRACVIDPRFVLWLLQYRTGRGYEETVRPWCAEVKTSGAPPRQDESQGGRDASAWRGIYTL